MGILQKMETGKRVKGNSSNTDLYRRFILGAVVIGFMVTIFYMTFHVISPFLGILATAVIFSIFLNPIYKWLTKATSKDSLAAFLTVLSFLFFIIFPLGSLISGLFSEGVSVARSIQTDPGWIDSAQTEVENRLNSLQIPVDIKDLNVNEQIYQSLSFITGSLRTVVFRSAGVLLDLFFTLITIYFLLKNQKRISTFIQDLNLFPKQYLKQISSRITEIVNGTVKGYLLVVVLQLLAGVAGFFIFQIPAAILLGSVYGLSSLLPVVGGLLIWVPVVIWQFAIGNTLEALMITMWFLLLSFLIENIISPKIIGKTAKLHQLLVMFSVFGGIQYFGLLGLVLGPVIIALAFVALSILKEMVADRQPKS